MDILAVTGFLGEKKYLEPLKETISGENADVLVFTGGMASGEECLKVYEKAEEEGRQKIKTKDEVEKEIEQKEREMDKFMGFLEDLDIPSVLIPGRTDSPVKLYKEKVEQRLKQSSNIHSAQLKYVQIEGYLFSGSGGLVGNETEEYFQYKVSSNKLINAISNLKSFRQEKIFLFHTPPALSGLSDNSLASQRIKKLIEELEPKLVFYGMITPEKKMRVINNTVAVNPGPLCEGNYAIVNTVNMDVDFKNLEG